MQDRKGGCLCGAVRYVVVLSADDRGSDWPMVRSARSGHTARCDPQI